MPFFIRITVVALAVTGQSLPSNGKLSKSCTKIVRSINKVQIAEKLHGARSQFSGGGIKTVYSCVCYKFYYIALHYVRI